MDGLDSAVARAALDAGRRLVEALRQPACYDHPCRDIEVVETHLSWVVLTGPYAYKLKKPVDLGFADFSTLALRRAACEQELRLNRRLAPLLYRDVVAITGTPEAPRVGGDGLVLEHAVRMVQFGQGDLAGAQLRAGRLGASHVDRLAADVAAFHASVPWAGGSAGRGAPESTHLALRGTLARLRAMPGWGARLEPLVRWCERRFEAIAPALEQRRRAGCVRECHGDLHLGNMALLDGRLVMFDCIEFNPALRWIDTASDIAFTVMDLAHHGAPALAHRFLNAYLEATGDHGALNVLDYFLVYRALVRADVAAIRATQRARQREPRAAALAEARAYLALARRYTRRPQPALIITHGVAGSGKTTLAQQLLERHGLIRVRSDVERKRLFRLDPFARTGPDAGQGLYDRAATAATYAALRDRAALVVQAGYGVVVDATFLRRDQRAAFAELARRLGCPFRILACTARASTLRARVAGRCIAREDASDATPAVVDQQLAACEPPGPGEREWMQVVDTELPGAAERVACRPLPAARDWAHPAPARRSAMTPAPR